MGDRCWCARVRLSKAYRDQYDHQESRTEGRDESVTQRAILCRKQSGEPGENCCSRPTHGEYPSPRGKFQHERKQKRINRPQTQPSECGAHPDCCRSVRADEHGHRGSEAPESQTHYPAAALRDRSSLRISSVSCLKLPHFLSGRRLSGKRTYGLLPPRPSANLRFRLSTSRNARVPLSSGLAPSTGQNWRRMSSAWLLRPSAGSGTFMS